MKSRDPFSAFDSLYTVIGLGGLGSLATIPWTGWVGFLAYGVCSAHLVLTAWYIGDGS